MASYKGAEIHFDDASIERRFAFFPRGNDMANEQVSEQRLDQLIVREAGTEVELALLELKARRGGIDNWKDLPVPEMTSFDEALEIDAGVYTSKGGGRYIVIRDLNSRVDLPIEVFEEICKVFCAAP